MKPTFSSFFPKLLRLDLKNASAKLAKVTELYINSTITTKDGVDQMDEDLINVIRKFHMIPPSSRPYNLTSNDNPSMGQGQLIELLFGTVCR